MDIINTIVKNIYIMDKCSPIRIKDVAEKKMGYRKLKQTTLNKYTYIDEADGIRYLRRYDALRLFVGYRKDKKSALIQVIDTTYNEGVVEYHLGEILSHEK